MKASWLSVIIPCFNASAWVVDAIDSVLNQCVAGVEVVAVDDGSTDDTWALLNAFGARIRAVRKSNGGVVSARRTGVQHATGIFIKFLDADDLLPGESLARLRTIASTEGNDVLIGRAAVTATADAKPAGQMYAVGYQPEHLAEVRKEFLLTQATHSSLWIIPRTLFSRFELFTPDGIQMGEEFDFCMRLIATGAVIRYVDVLVSLVRIHDSPNRLSRSVDESRHLGQAAQVVRAVDFIREHIPDHSQAAMELLARMCWSRGRHCLRIGCAAASQQYFDLAGQVDPTVRPVGSTAYRMLCAVVGPRRSEAALQAFKSLPKRLGA